MNKEILEYIKNQRVGVLAVEMLDGSPHSATVHFSHTEDPLVFYFETSNKYRKAEPLLNNNETRASFVIGSDESDMKTLQLDGIAKLLTSEEKENFKEQYFNKFSEKKEKSLANPDAIFFKFTPNWWRFTNWTKPEGKTILTSDGEKIVIKK